MRPTRVAPLRLLLRTQEAIGMVDVAALSPVQFLLPIFFAADRPVGSDFPNTGTDELLIVRFKLQGSWS